MIYNIGAGKCSGERTVKPEKAGGFVTLLED